MSEFPASGTTVPSWRELLAENPVVPVIVASDPSIAGPLAEALVDSGMGIAEVTMRTDAAIRIIEEMSTERRLFVGVGTVTSPTDVDRAAEAGARFVVSPGLSAPIADRCGQLGLPYLPGVASATEIMAALEMGLTTLKLFPADALGGLKMVRQLAGPFPTVRFVPTGGITEHTASDYLADPAVLAVGGSWMVPKGALTDGSFDEVRRAAATAAALGRRLA